MSFLFNKYTSFNGLNQMPMKFVTHEEFLWKRLFYLYTTLNSNDRLINQPSREQILKEVIDILEELQMSFKNEIK